MPVKDSVALNEMYVIMPNGEVTKLGKIKEAEIVVNTSYDIDIDDTCYFQFPRECTFTVSSSQTIDSFYSLIYGRLPSNNWRKMHGFPLRRAK